MKIVVDKPEQVAAWASKQLNLHFVQPFAAVGYEKDGKPVGAVIFNDYTGENIEISIVGGWSRRMFHDIGDYVFNQLGCQRMTARTAAHKQKVINVMIGAGFRVEGRARCYYPDGADAILFGMLRQECNWGRDLSSERSSSELPQEAKTTAPKQVPLSDSPGQDRAA